MLEQTRNNLTRFKALLLRQQKKVEENIKDIEKEDLVMQPSLAESSEPGTDSWLADIHTRSLAAKQNLLDLLSGIKKALFRIKAGNYGKCERCGKTIEPERLEALPTATLCIACSKLSSKSPNKSKK